MWILDFDQGGFVNPRELDRLVDARDRFVAKLYVSDSDYDHTGLRGNYQLVTNWNTDNPIKHYFHTAKELTLYLSLFIPNLQALIEKHGGVYEED